MTNDPTQFPSNRESTSCQRIASNYADAAQNLGISETLPCETPPLPPCPCEQLAGWVNDPVHNSTDNLEDVCLSFTNQVAVRDYTVDPFNTIYVATYYNNRCAVINEGQRTTLLLTTPEESLSCDAQINAFRVERGLESCDLHP